MQKTANTPGQIFHLLYIKYWVSGIYRYWNSMCPRKKTICVDAFQTQTVAAQKHRAAPASLWAAVGRPQARLHILSLPNHLDLTSIMKNRRAFGGSIPQNHLELTVKSELYVFWPKLTVTSMDSVILIIRVLKFPRQNKRCNSWDRKCNISVLRNESFDQSLQLILFVITWRSQS